MIKAVALDYGGTISADSIDHVIGQKPVDPAAATALRALHDGRGLRLILASNTMPCETRWPALQQAGIDRLMFPVSGSRNRSFTGWSSPPPSHRPAR
jgi:hydroxymethylpyrimidine pyrophosphatase-like HAD family hydrolase